MLDSVKIVGDVCVFLMGCGGIWVDVFGFEKNLCMVYDYEMIEVDIEIVDGGEVVFFLFVIGG